MKIGHFSNPDSYTELFTESLTVPAAMNINVTSFRHSFITKFYDMGAQQVLIQTVVGHSKNAGIKDRYSHYDSLSS